MSAQGIKDDLHLQLLMSSPEYVAQEKLDGMRAVVHITKTGLRIFSRSAGVADPTRPLEKTSALPHLSRLMFPDLAGTVLDGEILLPGKDSAELSGTIHRNHTNGVNHQVKLFVFDILRHCGNDLTSKTLAERLPWLLTAKLKMQGNEHIRFLPFATTLEEKKKLYESVFSNGGEGIVLKNITGIYMQGGRPANNWFKFKKSREFDVVCIGFTKGAGKYSRRIGALVFSQFINGKLTEIGQTSGMTDALRNEMSDHPERFIGKVVTIRGMERLRSGAIRHPRYVALRTDKNPKDCVYYEGEQ